MALANIVNIEDLSQPISLDSPCGEDIRNDRSPNSDYYAIKDARNNARAAERSSMFDEGVDLITPWQDVIKLAPDILKNKSKDLEVASWFTEGLIRLHGIPGLRDGLQLIRILIEQHWDGLYPEIDEDGMETKVAPLSGLNGDGAEGTLLAPIRNAPLTAEGDFGGFNLWQYQKARDNDKLTDDDEKAARTEALGFSLQDIEKTIAGSSAEFCSDMLDTLQEASNDYKVICSLLRDHCGSDAPPSSNINNLLEELIRSTRFLTKDKLEAAQAQEPSTADGDDSTEAGEAVTASGVATAPGVATGAIVSREDALKRLQDVADYFRMHEPHTPIAPGIERLVKWGRMTVSELMIELLPEDHTRSLFTQLTGVKLDGSDQQTYVAPPPPAPADAAPAASTSAAPEAPEQATGW